MRVDTAGRAAALGALSGMRSMSGPAALGMRLGHERPRSRAARMMTDQTVTRMLPAFAVAEMLADKLPFIPNRTDALPLAGRALMGALVGGVLARQERSSVWLGSIIGAVTAVAVAHIAYHARRYAREHTALPDTALAMLEDGIVMGIGATLRARR